MSETYHFANILFAGPCNLRCPYCIGQQLNPGLNQNNLDLFPLQNIDQFVYLLQQNKIAEITFTGTTTDPQLYRHEARLLAWLRERLPRQTQFSLHTNGQLALHKIDTFNQYNRVSLSLPSFNPHTYWKMTGRKRMPNLSEIMRQANVPVKVSCVINEHNIREAEEFLDRCGQIGIKRVVFRQLYGDTRRWNIFPRLTPVATYHGNPVFSYHGIQVTLWDFHQTHSRSLNLFSNGLINPHYLLASAHANV
jgi:molybdenum cofactor biosynthesis enzyme MoaA